jgi:hypothetical protein
MIRLRSKMKMVLICSPSYLLHNYSNLFEVTPSVYGVLWSDGPASNVPPKVEVYEPSVSDISRGISLRVLVAQLKNNILPLNTS